MTRGTNGTAATQGRPSAEVLAQLQLARCRGELPFDGETGRSDRDVALNPYALPHCR